MGKDLIEGYRVLGNKMFIDLLDRGERMTAGGIIQPDDDMKDWGIRPRKALVLAAGPDAIADGIEPGYYVLLPHGAWTRKLMTVTDVNGIQRGVWSTDTEQVIVYSTEDF